MPVCIARSSRRGERARRAALVRVHDRPLVRETQACRKWPILRGVAPLGKRDPFRAERVRPPSPSAKGISAMGASLLRSVRAANNRRASRCLLAREARIVLAHCTILCGCRIFPLSWNILQLGSVLQRHTGPLIRSKRGCELLVGVRRNSRRISCSRCGSLHSDEACSGHSSSFPRTILALGTRRVEGASPSRPSQRGAPDRLEKVCFGPQVPGNRNLGDYRDDPDHHSDGQKKRCAQPELSVG
jgi:hypothetical protein